MSHTGSARQAGRRILVTGSAGHLGEALVRTLRADAANRVTGIDIKASPCTDIVGTIADPHRVASCMAGIDTVYHTATLHKPHVVTHSKQDFVDTNITGTLNLLEAARSAGVERFVFTSTTSVYGDAMRPGPGEPAAWVTEATIPIPKNIYGVTKLAAESLCELFARRESMNCIILRTSRFFPEADDDAGRRSSFDDTNLKAVEFLYRRAEIADIVDAHLLAADQCEGLGFGRFIISATTPFTRDDLTRLNEDAAAVLDAHVPGWRARFEALGWQMLPRIDRVYVNTAARQALGWQPRFDFDTAVEQAVFPLSDLGRSIGSKGYHEETFSEGPYPVRE